MMQNIYKFTTYYIQNKTQNSTTGTERSESLNKNYSIH